MQKIVRDVFESISIRNTSNKCNHQDFTLESDNEHTFTSKVSLRKELRRIFLLENSIVEFQIRQVILAFVEERKFFKIMAENKGLHVQGQTNSLFKCKCGWLLYNPSTHPCGHTTCKDCADCRMMCKMCNLTLKIAPSTSHFLEQIVALWYEKEYEATKYKKEATNFIAVNEHKKALEKINVTLRLIEKDFTALNIRSKIYSNLGHHQKALLDAESSCNINGMFSKSHFRRGLCLSNLGKLDSAIDAFQMCLELEPEDAALSNDVIIAIDNLLSPTNTEVNLTNIPLSEDVGDTVEDDSLVLALTSNAASIDTINEQENVQYIHDVPAHLIKEEDFECKICYEFLFKPVTTPCGHVFCRNCLLRMLDYNLSCPICRISLTQYQSNKKKAETVLIEDILRLYFTSQWKEKVLKYENRLKELSRVGVDEDVEIPIFVCSIAFPHVSYSFHIFEPKYRLMVRECLESGSKKFGICIPAKEGEVSDVGTVCEVLSFQSLPDGRFIIQAIAGQRFMIRSRRLVETLHYACVSYFNDEDEQLDKNQLSVSARNIYNNLTTYYSSLAQTEQQCVFNALGSQPEFECNFARFPHGLPWVWWGLASLPINQTAKLVLLRSKSVSERMFSLQRFVNFLSKIQPAKQAEDN